MLDVQAVLKNFHDQRELMEDAIHHGIETHRKGYFRFNFTDAQGQPLKGVQVELHQDTHDFLFGCNIFKYQCFPTPQENALYEERFAKLFNLAIAPFYWDSFEPEQGKPRFEKDAPFIDRRPAPEAVLAFCREKGIQVKGHPLYWTVMLPDWLPQDYEEMKPLLTKRLREIAQRYDGVIKSFDCVNEATSVPLLDYEPNGDTHYRNFSSLQGDYVEWVFRQADRFFADSRLVVNETVDAWTNFRKELSPYYLLIQRLLERGCRIDTIGLQYHNFNTPETMPSLAEMLYNPSHLLKVMDCYGRFNRPLSVSEITVPGYDDALQAEVLTHLYRLWFSHRNMESIVYWNLGDNCAIALGGGWAEDQYKSGLTDADFAEKPSYKALDRLINHEWRTNVAAAVPEDHLYAKCFYGNYTLTARLGERTVTRKLHLSKTGFDTFQVVL